MASLYEDAQRTKSLLVRLIKECIREDETIKACIKARRGIVTAAADSVEQGKVNVRLIGDQTELLLPYNSSFSASDLTVNTLVSVWYNYSLNNGVVMQDATWTK